jgi:hypothetical protein
LSAIDGSAVTVAAVIDQIDRTPIATPVGSGTSIAAALPAASTPIDIVA